MAPLLLVLPLVLSALTISTGQEPVTASFHMHGVNGSATFTLEASNLTVMVTLSESLGAGPISVEIRPIWVDYDVADKCSSIQLGAVINQLVASMSFANNSGMVTFPNVNSLVSLGGHSILLNGSSKVVCASIEVGQERDTAVAQFQDLVQGTVYFRQFLSKSARVVSDLYSGQPNYSSSWFITDTVDMCSLITSQMQLKEFNPNNANGTGCTVASQDACAVGQLTGKLGNVTIGQNRKDARLGYTDNNLPSISALNGKLLLIRTSNGSLACAAISVFSTREAKVEFSHDGVTGSITFSQKSPFDSTATIVDLKGLNYMTRGYHVHLWPTPTKIVNLQDLCGDPVVSGHFNPYNKNVSDSTYPLPDTSTDDMYEVGDLSSKYGTLAMLPSILNTYIDWNLPLYGPNSIIGRSLVIHHNDSANSRWVCSNIQPISPSVVAAVAVFKYPVIGEIMFIQEQNQAETSVFAKLDYNDGRSGTKNHMWMINTMQATNDTLSTEVSRCLSTGSIYNPQNLWHQLSQPQYNEYCSKNSPLGCKLGDLSGKLRFLNIRNTATSDTSTRQFFTDVNLPLSGPYSVIGKSVVIMNEQGTYILACANIQLLREPALSASILMGSISGTVSFKQTSGFGAKKTMVMSDLQGLSSKHRLWIYELPPISGTNSCSDLGNVFNPLNITQNASLSSTDDKYMVGDLSRNEVSQMWYSFNLPLTGLASIKGRSLVIVDQDSQNKVVACAMISECVTTQCVEAVSTFTGAVTGTIHLFQTVYDDGALRDTSILVNLTKQDGQKSFRHNWHTHIYPVLGDANAAESRCASTGPHFDPSMTMKNLTNYASECRPDNPLRCEVGDQSSKLSTYDIGGGRKMFNDVDLPLAGTFSVQGRSIVIHVADKGAARYACADIIPVTNDAVSVKIKSAAVPLNRSEVASVYAKAINANLTDVVIEFISESDNITTVHVHFLGSNRILIRSKFEAILGEKDKSSLSPYGPYTGAAHHIMVSTILLLVTLSIQLLN